MEKLPAGTVAMGDFAGGSMAASTSDKGFPVSRERSAMNDWGSGKGSAPVPGMGALANISSGSVVADAGGMNDVAKGAGTGDGGIPLAIA
jgi:hypothetical protein